jgi:phosphomannomutase / phosphoglucomutase
MLKQSIFREYDIRGVAETDLPSAGVELLGKAFGTYIQQKTGGRKVNVGRDTRLSSPRLRDALIKGLKSTGCDVTDIGIVPTPVLYFSQKKLNADGAVMITGSHNPGEFNGFKTMVGPTTISGPEIQEVFGVLSKGEFTSGSGNESTYDIVTPYVEDIAGRFDFKRKFKIVFDGGNGVAGPVMQRLIEKLNLNAETMYFDMDGNFPNHHPDPTVVENVSAMQAKVRETGAELGIAFDGDSDRIGAVDENGEMVYGDMLMLIYAREILTRKPGSTFIGEVKCSQLLYDELKRLGGNPIMFRTGHSLIKAKMKAEHAELAGEMSGHMFFADNYYGFDDALYAALRLIDIVDKSGQPLSAQLAALPKMISTPEIRFDSPDDVKFGVVAKVVEHFKKSQYPTIDVDGARVNFGKGWGLVRASNTQPVLVMRFEAETQQLLDEYRNIMESAIKAAQA